MVRGVHGEGMGEHGERWAEGWGMVKGWGMEILRVRCKQ